MAGQISLKGSLAVATPIFPPELGGPATFSKNFGTFLEQQGVAFTVYGKFGRGAGESWYQPMRLGHGRLANLLERWRIARLMSRHERLLAVNMEQEVLLAQLFKRGPYAIKIPGDPVWEACQARGLTQASLEDFCEETIRDPRIIWHRFLRRHYFRRARAIITPSHYLADIVRRHYHPLQKIHVIPNAVRFAVPAELAERRMSNHGGRRVLWMGRLVGIKQPDFAVRLARACPDIEVDIAGTGPLAEILRAQAASLGNVRLLGAVHSSELLAGGRYDIFINTSTYEGHPHALLEAMGAGLPVCALPNGGARELLEKFGGGVLAQNGSFEAFLSAFQALQTGVVSFAPVDQHELRRRHDPEVVFMELLHVIGNM